ncbi:MAG: ABC transporter substrate-binding protein [Actinobacteria bacterium]|nr:ABC transporter substrate-binding protein [Actinomycetota bacterium]
MAAEPRIVSLVPSVTELVCDLRLAPRLVGRTGFCVHPWETVRRVPKVGGTKDVRLERVRELAPTHVIVNVEENRREDAEALAEFVPEVIVTDPRAPRDNLDLYRQLGAAFGREREAEHLCRRFERAYASAAAAAAERPAERVLYLIWRDPWMTVAEDTYISRTLALFNWHTQPATATLNAAPTNVCNPEGYKRSAVRYPEVELADFAGRVDRVLLSSEPFHFKERHLEEVAAAVPGAAVSLIDGEMTSWYGSRAITGLGYLSEYTSGAASCCRAIGEDGGG